MTRKVVIEEYNVDWPRHFAQLREKIWPSVSDIALSIEHVGSTSVPGLAAKPIIDIDIVIESSTVIPEIIRRLEVIGYTHRGNLGIEGREAFSTGNQAITHNLYACLKDAVALKNHLLLRDRLRADAGARARYSELKTRLAAEFPHSIDDYIEGKTAFILEILAADGIGKNHLLEIEAANKKR